MATLARWLVAVSSVHVATATEYLWPYRKH